MLKMVGAILLAAVLMPAPAWSWGKKGHRTVGAVADMILENHPQTRARVRAILADAIKSDPGSEQPNLHDAALWADCVKGICGPLKTWQLEFKDNNGAHGEFHYTDIPLQQPKYASGKAGRNSHDVVQLINYAVSVLRDQESEHAPANISEGEALWLLAHLVGDIHQPLHVGAVYYDDTCKNQVDPNVKGKGKHKFGIGKTIAETVGGNNIAMPDGDSLHHFWDDDTVEGAIRLANLPSASARSLARWIVDQNPTGWEMTGDVSTWAEKWADEAIPISKEAHERLTINFAAMTSVPPKIRCTWSAVVPSDYEVWAAKEAQKQLTRAGFRLAAMLRAIYE